MLVASEEPPLPTSPPAPVATGLRGLSSLGAKQQRDPEEASEATPPVPRTVLDGPVDDGMVELKGSMVKLLWPKNGDRTTGFRLFLVKRKGEDDVVMKTTAPSLVADGEKFIARGKWEQFRGKTTFNAALLTSDLPKETAGIVAWIKSAVPGVGSKKAAKLGEHFGADLKEAIGDPEALQRAGVSEKDAVKIADSWNNSAMHPETVSFLGSLGLGEGTITKIMRRYSVSARQVIEENPWRLADTIEGIGFHTADEIGIRHGHSHSSPDRIGAGIRFAMRNAINMKGHCGLPPAELVSEAAKLTGLSADQIRAQLPFVLEGGSLFLDEATGLVAPKNLSSSERRVADHLIAMNARRSIDAIEAARAVDAAQARLKIKLDPSQREAAIMAVSNNVCIITGGPGTGKSTTQKVIVETIKSFGLDVVLAAPTGRAAKRLSEVSGMDASTCHRLLQFRQEINDFMFNSENPFPEDRFVVDEFSMVDVRLADSFIQAIKVGSGLTIVGDVDQLPSVGPGQVLRDLIESGAIPVARLTTVHRQGKDSGIVVAAHNINAGRHPMPINGEPLNGFQIDRQDHAEDVVRRIVDLVDRDLPEQGFDPIRDVQVLAAMRRGDVGVERLNEAIKAALNPARNDEHTVRMGNRPFTVGDRVMHIRNDYAKGVYNGEVGTVSQCGMKAGDNGKEEPFFVVDYSGFTARYGRMDSDDVEQAWAATVHKSQGCEFPVVVFAAHYSHLFMLNRNLVYTAVTRAKSRCIVVGSDDVVEDAVGKADETRRYTGLAKSLREAAARAAEEPDPEPEDHSYSGMSPRFIQIEE